MYGIRGNSGLEATYLIDHSMLLLMECNQKFEGSILGPLLIIIYMNDICNASDLLYTILYEDDTSVLLNGKNIQKLMDIINS